MPPRPFKPRSVVNPPPASSFVPENAKESELLWIHLTLDEYEASRLIDEEGYSQEDAAKLMGVSRPTVTRILSKARTKLAQMLSNGAALIIEGGPTEKREEGENPEQAQLKKRFRQNWLSDGKNCPNNPQGQGRGRCRCQRNGRNKPH